MWCWWCCHDFDGQQLHLPYKYDSHRNKFETMGCFCSWGCMKSYNRTYNRTRSAIIATNIVLMYKSMYGKVDTLFCAPNRHSLKEFGGTLSIEEFRKLSERGTRVIVNMPDEIHHMQEVIVRRELKTPTEVDHSNKFHEISQTGTTNETLKIKRQKPLKRDENNLEKTLGIIRKK
jgi:hypothetical protein